MRPASALALVALAGCLGAPAPAPPTDPGATSPTTAPACGMELVVLDEREDLVPGLLATSLEFVVPPTGCGQGSAVLDGTLSGSIVVTWEGGEGGCPSVTVVSPAVLTCWEDGLPAGTVRVAVDLRGAGRVTLQVSHFPPPRAG